MEAPQNQPILCTPVEGLPTEGETDRASVQNTRPETDLAIKRIAERGGVYFETLGGVGGTSREPDTVLTTADPTRDALVVNTAFLGYNKNDVITSPMP